MAGKRKRGGAVIWLAGALAGAAIGAAVALVYTPGTGEENRQRITKWVDARTGDVQSRVTGSSKP